MYMYLFKKKIQEYMGFDVQINKTGFFLPKFIKLLKETHLIG